jgi:hypothetical protein
MVTDPSYLSSAAAANPDTSVSGGASGYFSSPSDTLDPSLFNGDVIKPEVRAHLVVELYEYLEHQHFHALENWLTVWVAGSGVSYQWGGDRGNGDLDILFGVQWTRFLQSNPGFGGYSEPDFAAQINEGLKAEVWPKTAATKFGGKSYEVTYFLNPGTEDNITTRLHPYAAYNLTTNEWTVRPPKLPSDPVSLYPSEWFTAAYGDTRAAQTLSSRYAEHLAALNGSTPGSPSWHTAGAMLNLVTAQAAALFEDIHGGRREAFSGQGNGYGDFHNFRWQVAKQSGAVQSLHAITQVGVEALQDEQRATWGQVIDPAEVVLRRAAQAHNQDRN